MLCKQVICIAPRPDRILEAVAEILLDLIAIIAGHPRDQDEQLPRLRIGMMLWVT